MKSLSYLIPVCLGVVTVLQAAFNRKIGVDWSIGSAVLLNTVVVLLITIVAIVSGWLPPRLSMDTFRPWYLLPGLFGFLIVVGIPYAITNWGAMHTFVWLIAAQMLASALWDYGVEGIPFSWQRLAGGIIAIGGAWIFSRPTS